MVNKGLYYYKLVSPYKEDVSKDCKLTINEIDSNFLSLKNEDIKDITVDKDKKEIVALRNDGQKIVLELSDVNPEMNIGYNGVDGVIEISYDNERYTIDGLITKENLSKEILTKVYSDSSLKGTGTSNRPLMISPISRTSFYKPVKRLIDTTRGERMPQHHVEKGDRYVVLAETSDYGLLYDFEGVKHINRMLCNTGWRVPSKADWDNMLNALEPCEFRNHNMMVNNRVLGRMAGTLLKAQNDWVFEPDHCHHDGFKPNLHEEEFYQEESSNVETESYFDDEYKFCKSNHSCYKPTPKPIPSIGKDAYGMSILPAGYAYFSRPMQFVNFGTQGAFWTTDMLYDSDVYTKVFTKQDSGVLQIGERPSAFLSIRLVKDYDGTNHNDVENILGKNYKTILMPTLNNSNGYTIWTAQNISVYDKCLHAVEPNAGLGLTKRNIYFVYEWNGFDWDKIELVEGDAVIIKEGKRPNEVYRIIQGVLTNTEDEVIKIIRNEMIKDITDIKIHIDEMVDVINTHDERITSLEATLEENSKNDEELKTSLNELTETVNTNIEKIEQLQEDVKTLDEKVDTEVNDLKNKDNELAESITNVSNELNTKIDESIEDVKNTISSVSEELNDKIDSVEEELNNKIEAEGEERKSDVNKLSEEILETQTNLESEATSRENEDKRLDDKIDSVEEELNNKIAETSDRLDEETKTREENEAEINKRIDEVNSRLTNDYGTFEFAY